MPRHWAKLHSKLRESEHFASVARDKPLPALMFLMSLPHTDMYGVMPGTFELMTGAVCPLLRLKETTFIECLTVLNDSGLFHVYGPDGKPSENLSEPEPGRLVWIPGWSDHQNVRWTMGVAVPSRPLPQCWRMPEDLAVFIEGNPDHKVSQYFTRLAGNCCSTAEALLKHFSLEVEGELEVEVDRDERSVAARVHTYESPTPIKDPQPADELQIAAMVDKLPGKLAKVATRKRWCENLLEAARDPRTPLSADEIIAAGESDGPGVTDTPDTWLRRVIGKKMGKKRGKKPPPAHAPSDWDGIETGVQKL